MRFNQTKCNIRKPESHDNEEHLTKNASSIVLDIVVNMT